MDMLLADCLLSTLAALALLILRQALLFSGFHNRLQRMLRFAALVLSLFYLLRVATWLSDADILDRLMLMFATLIPLALLLVTEAALRQHAPRTVKLGLVVAVPALMLGALFVPSTWAAGYLSALLALQLGSLGICTVLLWRGAQNSGQTERRLQQLFGWLLVLSLPVIFLDFGFSRKADDVHGTATAVIVGVWLLFSVRKASNLTRRLLSGAVALSGASAALTFVVTGRITDGQSLSLSATFLGVLTFVAIIVIVTERQPDALSNALMTLLSQRFGTLDMEAVLDVLRDQVVVVLEPAALQGMDTDALKSCFDQSPLWPGKQTKELPDPLSDIARTHQATHLLCLAPEPLTIAALRLGPTQSGHEVQAMMTALARRLEGERKNG